MTVKMAKWGGIVLVVGVLGYFALTVAANYGVSLVFP